MYFQQKDTHKHDNCDANLLIHVKKPINTCKSITCKKMNMYVYVSKVYVQIKI
jgi:hypothetical protein